MLVVLERTGAQGHLFLDHFFLLSNAEPAEADAEALLARYRQRGVAEKDFGEWKQAAGVPLSSSPREKSHYRGQPVQQPYQEPGSFGANEARLLLGLIAANVLHAGAALLEREAAARMSRGRFRQLVLKTAARVVLTGRRITVVIGAARARLWRRFHREMNRLYPVRGSPPPGALPVPA
jgi:hypothetical protein